jgi:hypothetical protein
MGPFDMVAFIVLVGVIGGVIRSIVKARSANAAGGTLTAEQTARLTKLEDRVKALEAVVGDSSYELKQKLRELER